MVLSKLAGCLVQPCTHAKVVALREVHAAAPLVPYGRHGGKIPRSFAVLGSSPLNGDNTFDDVKAPCSITLHDSRYSRSKNMAQEFCGSDSDKNVPSGCGSHTYSNTGGAHCVTRATTTCPKLQMPKVHM